MDHLGFNFVPSSRRFIEPSQAKRLAERVGGQCQLVGVFMDQSREKILRVLETVPLDAIQLHGSESPEFCAALPIPVWKVFAVGQGWDPGVLLGYRNVAAKLFDTATKGGVSGGTGKIFDWSLLPANPGHPWYLAGGLSPENLAGAIDLCRPDGVDLNSGVESAPGIKDPEKLRAAMRIVSACRGLAGVSKLPGSLAPNVEVEGHLWPCWRLGSQRQNPELELRGLLELLEIHDRVVLDLTQRQGNPADVASELIRWQMLARERGRHIKFKVSETMLDAFIRFSFVPLLDIVD